MSIYRKSTVLYLVGRFWLQKSTGGFKSERRYLSRRRMTATPSCRTFLVSALHPVQVGEVGLDLGEVLGLVVEVVQRDVHAAELVLEGGRAGGVRARVVLLPRVPRRLHAGRVVVQRLGLVVPVPGTLARVHAVLPSALDRVPPHSGVGHVVHVWYAVVHHEEPKPKPRVNKSRISKKENGGGVVDPDRPAT